jgi:PPK2 family polyphosphate:nucleotide phosphotransferase
MSKDSESNTLKTVRPIIANGKTKLSAVDTASNCSFAGDKSDLADALAQINQQLVDLQVMLYAQHKHKVLVLFQAMDAGGKDGVIRKVFTGVNPQGVRVASFKAPTPEELDHDYLWRIHRQMPGRGELTIFNRSHYEDVLITRVHGWVDDATAKRRFRQINDFEVMLVEEGTLILKFFLHISKAEQKERMQERLDDSTKTWKFNPADLDERKKWDDYQRVYEEAINATSTPHAPWYIVPADKKGIRDVYVASVLVSALKNLKMSYPVPAFDPAKIKIPD